MTTYKLVLSDSEGTVLGTVTEGDREWFSTQDAEIARQAILDLLPEEESLHERLVEHASKAVEFLNAAVPRWANLVDLERLNMATSAIGADGGCPLAWTFGSSATAFRVAKALGFAADTESIGVWETRLGFRPPPDVYVSSPDWRAAWAEVIVNNRTP